MEFPNTDVRLVDGATFEYGNPLGLFGSMLVPSNSYDCKTMRNSHNYNEYNTHAAKPGEAIEFMCVCVMISRLLSTIC